MALQLTVWEYKKSSQRNPVNGILPLLHNSSKKSPKHGIIEVIFFLLLRIITREGVQKLHCFLPLVKEVMLGTTSRTSSSTSRRYLEDLYYGFYFYLFSVLSILLKVLIVFIVPEFPSFEL